MPYRSTEFQVFVKPAGARCNLSCTYCYYLEKSDLYEKDFVRMSDKMLEKYIRQLAEASADKKIFFSWHGGEPTLAGLDFFKRAADLQKMIVPGDYTIINGLQTNATLIDDSWCKFLSEEGFLVGVSIDGPEQFHNKFRVSKEHRGSFRKTLDGYRRLRDWSINPEVLTVVNAENVQWPAEIYQFIKSLGSEFITFLPLVRYESKASSMASPESVPPESFGVFLCTIFEEWVSADLGKIKIQIIEEAARTAFKQEHTLCIFKEKCGGVPVVEQNGDFYSCDHFVDKMYLVGNIEKVTLSEMINSTSQLNFGLSKYTSLPQYCLDCEVLAMCNGECPRNRFAFTPSGEPGLNYLCKGYKLFFNHIQPFINAISIEWSQRS